MMTSIAFIVGLAPLVWAEGASEIARRGVSTPVFVGMLAASMVGIFLIPMLVRRVSNSSREGAEKTDGHNRASSATGRVIEGTLPLSLVFAD